MCRFLLILFLVPHLVFGQEEQDSVGFNVDLQEYVITAQHRPTHYKKAIHPVSIITRELIHARGAINLEEALTTSTAIRLNRDPILGVSVSMRGISSSNVAILVDGIPVIGRNGGGIDVSQIPLHNVDRIEIVEGPLSNIYGNNAAGGVINIITESSQVSTFSAEVKTVLESVGQRTYAGSIGWQKNNWHGGLQGRYFSYNQFPEDSLRVLEEFTSEDGSRIFQSKFPYNPKEQIGYGVFIKRRIDNDGSLKFAYNNSREDVTDYGHVRRPTFNPYATDQFYVTRRQDLDLVYTHELYNGLYLDASLAYKDYNRTRRDERFLLETRTIDSTLTIIDNTDFGLLFGKWTAAYKLSNTLDFTLGGQYSKESASGDRIVNHENEDSLYTSFSEKAGYYEVKYNPGNKIVISHSGRYQNHNVYGNFYTPCLLYTSPSPRD